MIELSARQIADCSPAQRLQLPQTTLTAFQELLERIKEEHRSRLDAVEFCATPEGKVQLAKFKAGYRELQTK
jgi:hypothetical protein